jgi:uncharacterized membrane protein
MDNVLAINFSEDSKAYEALSLLKDLDGQDQVDLAGAAVVVRSEDGRVEIKDDAGDTGYSETATGGVIGLIVGILGGPFGVLIGGATGLLIGSLFDLDDAEETESVLSEISRSVRPGHAALLAEVSEQSPDAVDAAMERLGGSVLRRSLDDVNAEIAAAEDAQAVARREARKRLREERRTQVKDKIREKVEDLKAKLRRGMTAGAGA